MSISKKLLSWPSLFALTLALVFFLVGPTQAQAQNVGVVDLRKAVEDSKTGKTTNNKLQSKLETMQKSVEAKQRELEKKEKDLHAQAQARTISEEAFNKRREELAKDIQSYQEQAQRTNKEMQKALADALNPLFTKAKQAASRIATERGFIIVIDVNEAGVMYYAPTIDITAEITKALDK
jgi:outer membrane protein